MSGDYDPKIPILREMLALSILNKLEDCGFNEVGFDDKTREKIFSRVIPDTRIVVKVYTTVVGKEVRGEGKDAIRVCAVYNGTDGSTKGIVKSTRVHRTGNINEICDRMHERMRTTWSKASTGKKCWKCNAPTFTSKSGKQVCAEICWMTKEQKDAEKLQYKFKQSAKRHSRSYRRRY